jgi:site-specific DNA-methyltransferase (adenine-specific)
VKLMIHASIREGIHHGDALDLIMHVSSGSVDTIITSPPYPGRAGGVHPDEFVAWWLPFAQEFMRVIKPGGSLVVNIKEPVVDGERHTCVFSLITAMRHMNWRWVDEYVWHKSATTPGYWPNRLRDGWERCLHFSKQPRFSFFADQISVPVGKWAKRERLAPADLVRTESRTGSASAVRRSNWNGRSEVHPSNVLHFACETQNVGHPCAYPEKLPEFFIQLLTRGGDLVLDPFLGSGTTAAVATRLGRRFIGFEKEKYYFEIAQRRVDRVKRDAGNPTVRTEASPDPAKTI